MSESDPTTTTTLQQETAVEYRDIPEFPGYRVGNDGSVWSRWELKAITVPGYAGFRGTSAVMGDVWKRLRPAIRSRYPSVGFRGKMRYVHRLVLELFVGPCPPGMECCHNDGNRANNRLENLRWDTHAQNNRDKVQHGTGVMGIKHYAAKLTEEDVRNIRSRWASGGVTQRQLAREYKVCYPTMSNIIARKIWRHI